MTTILHDLFRAGLRGVDKTPETSRMMSYIMAHAPGTTAKMWRRAMYGKSTSDVYIPALDWSSLMRLLVNTGYIAHGVTMINLYEFRPCIASYTENYVDAGWGMYGGVRQALGELSLFEDIVQSGSVMSGDVGIWNSDVMDIWGPATPPLGEVVHGQHFNSKLLTLTHFCVRHVCSVSEGLDRVSAMRLHILKNRPIIRSILGLFLTEYMQTHCSVPCRQEGHVHCAAARRARRRHGR